jgi:glycosyltransferase involved in cell wall biosynthesis
MKALVIAPQPFFSPRGTPFSVYYRTMVTSELGVEIDFLTYGEGQDVNIPGVRIIRIPRFRCFGNVKIGPSFLKLFLDGFMILWTVALLLRNRYDFVHAHEEAVFFCRFLKPIFRYKLVYDMHSSLPQQLTNFQFTTSKILIGIFKKLEDSCLRAADAVITICPDLANYVNSIIVDRNKHFLIENSIFEPVKLTCTDSKRCHAEQCEETKHALPVNRRFVVYTGTLEPYQGIDILIRSFPEVLKKYPDAFLLIVGGNPRQVDSYQKLADSCGITAGTLFTGRVSQALAKFYSAQASVLLSPRSSGTNTPLKIYEQLASGIPLVATKIYSHTQVLDDTTAILVEPTPEDMARGIIEAFSERGQTVIRGAQKLYNDKYSRPVYETKMKKLLEILC